MPTLSPQARAHRADLAELARLAHVDLQVMFRQFDTADQVRDGLLDLLPKLMSTYGSAAATLGADWYDDLRADSDAKGRFRAIPADLPNEGRTDALARWSVGPLFSATPDRVIALSKVAGGFQRIIANADRDTITRSSTQDRGARGWAREGSPKCDLCTELIARGAVYTEVTADFETHDNCHCVAVPAFE